MEDEKKTDEPTEKSKDVTTSDRKTDSSGKGDSRRTSKRRIAKEVESTDEEKLTEKSGKRDDVMKDSDFAEKNDPEKPGGVTSEVVTDSDKKEDSTRKSKRRKVVGIEDKAKDVATKLDDDDARSTERSPRKGDDIDIERKDVATEDDTVITSGKVKSTEKPSDITKEKKDINSGATGDAEMKSDVKAVKKTKFTIKAKPKKSDVTKDKTDVTSEKAKPSEKSYDLKKTQNEDSDRKADTESEPLPPGVEKEDLAEPADDVTEARDVIKAGVRLEQADLEDALEMWEDEGEEGEDTELSHQEAMNIYQKNLAKIIEDDPLLCDLATTCTLEEVRGRVALEHGQAMTVNVVKDTAEIMGVFVVQEGTVLDLKQAIKQHVMLHLERNAINKHISWRYIWKTYWLYFEGQKLDDDRKKLKDYGIRNKSEVLFLKKLKTK